MNNTKLIQDAYSSAQNAIADLKSAIRAVLHEHHPDGLKNSEIGRILGIYQGHIRHEGHIPRTLLALMETEGVVKQDSETKKWSLCNIDYSLNVEDI